MQATSMPESQMARNVVRCVKEISAKEEQHWAEEEPKLDSAPKLKGIFHIDPEDAESNEIKKNARKTLGQC